MNEEKETQEEQAEATKMEQLIARLNVLEMEHIMLVERLKGMEYRLGGAVVISENVIGRAIASEMLKMMRDTKVAKVNPVTRKTQVID